MKLVEFLRDTAIYRAHCYDCYHTVIMYSYADPTEL